MGLTIHILRHGGGERGLYVKVIAGNHVKMVPELVDPVFLLVDLGIQALHDLNYRGGLLAPFRLVLNRLHLLHHFEHNPAVFRHLQFLYFGIVI